MNKKIVSRSLLVLSGLVSLAAAIFFACSGGGGGAVAVPPTTTSFVGTQSPGDFWTWTITKDINGSGSVTAENITSSFTYSGSVSQLSGNAAGISSMVITNTTDPSVTIPAFAFGIEMPNTMLMVATAPTFTFNHSGIVELSGRPPIFAAAQGACPSTGVTNVLWITMPNASWCPTVGASNPVSSCTQADDAYGTASVVVSGSTYTIDITSYPLDGTTFTTSTLGPCTCSEGVIACPSGEKIAFTLSGVFFVDTSGSPVAGVVQPDTDISIPDFLTNGKSFKGMWYTSWDDFTGGCDSDPSRCNAYPGGTCHKDHCGIPETSPVSVTANGTSLNASMYSDIKNGVLSPSGGSILVSGATQTVPGLIRTTLVTHCTSSIDSTTDLVMAVRQIQNKYVSLLISHSLCPTFDTGFNVMTVEQ